jgi:hypothetical protein
MKRILALLTAITIALALAALSIPTPPAGAVSDRLPDLGMAYPQDLRIEKTFDGRRLLRFSSIVVNVGDGKFEVRGQRSSTSASTMKPLTQRIYNDANGYRDVTVSTNTYMYYGGDGHNHWHVWELEDFELERLDNGTKHGTLAKQGFCFFDNYRYRTLRGTPGNPVYTHCGNASSLNVTMGLSVGWGDIYHYSLPDQYVDITSLTPGRYRLWGWADKSNWFVEKDNSNNFSWVDIQLKQSSVRIVAYGPQA